VSVTWPIAPMKATTGKLPLGEDWMYEPKWDGHRAIVRLRTGRVEALSSTGIARIDRWPWLPEAVRACCGADGDVVLDGEIIALDEDGRHSFQLVGRADRPHAFVVFDLLALDGADLLARPWHERRALLVERVRPAPPISITPLSDDAETMMQVTQANGFEGVIAKRRSSTYQPGRRSPSWVKVKHRFEQELVIGGYLVGEGNRSTTFGSLLVGHYEHGELRFAGAVGTGFNDVSLRELQQRFAKLATDACPFEPQPKLPRGKPRWLRPELVAQVSFAEWTEAGHLRHPVYLGLRDDKRPEDVVRER
jgi:bifunctional non-homologous end joining protein LigD